MQTIAIKCGELLDGTGARVRKQCCIYVRGERICRVSDVGRVEGADLVIDASDKLVIPGIIDAHKHLLNCGGSEIGLGLSLRQVIKHIQAMEESGVTSMLDIGSMRFFPFVEQRISHLVRVFHAVSILTCKGGYPEEYMPRLYYKLSSVIECGDRREIEKSVKKLWERGVAAIKCAVVSRRFTGEEIPIFSDSMLRYLCDAAHGYGLKVCAHITYAKDYEKAALCGVDSAHHAAFDEIISEDVMQLMIDRGMILVPTLSLADLMFEGLEGKMAENEEFMKGIDNKYVYKSLKALNLAYEEGEEDESIGNLFINIPKRQFRKVPFIQQQCVKDFIRLGGKVALGTDSALGFSLHRFPKRELELLHGCGLDNASLIHASTKVSADVFGKSHELGSIESGKMADIVILEGKSDNLMEALGRIHTIMIGGKVVKQKVRKNEK